jgi:hypothetical protein
MMSRIHRRQCRVDASQLTAELKELIGLNGVPFEEAVQLLTGIKLPHPDTGFERGAYAIDLRSWATGCDVRDTQVHRRCETSIQSHFLVAQEVAVLG